MKPRTDQSTSSTLQSVIASVLVEGDNLVLLRRSAAVKWDTGLWQCVTGYLEDGKDPWIQTIQELAEETSLDERQLRLRTRPKTVSIVDASRVWLVYCTIFEVVDGIVSLNWENDAISRVCRLEDLPGPFVSWLPQVLYAVGWREG
jgi:hypothetical protein